MFGTSNKFDPNTDIPDLSGRVFVVTGGSAGIGYGICTHLLQHNCATLYLLGKKASHLAAAQESLGPYVRDDPSRLVPIQVEFEDLQNTQSVAQRLAASLTRLDALVLNAGLGVGPYAETAADGLDSHMQVNVFAQHGLLAALLPVLARTPRSRAVLQSSELHRLGTGGVAFADLAEVNADIGPEKLYARSKLAQVLLVKALARRKAKGELGLSPGGPPWFIATHPGAVKTGQQDQAVEAYGTMGKIGVKAVRPFMKDAVDEGCRPALFAATSDAVVEEGLDGVYIVPDRKVTSVSSQGEDEELQERCYKLTVDVLEQKLGKVAA